MSKPALTPERLRELLMYSPETGEFVWRQSRRCVAAGDVAGMINRKLGYRQIGVAGVRYFAHRLAWLYVHGVWPIDQIDHANGDGTDNRICNLRLASQSENRCNMRRRCDNSSGYKGVTFHPQTGRWRARVTLRGQHFEAGLHGTPEAAHAAYKAMAAKIHGDYARFS